MRCALALALPGAPAESSNAPLRLPPAPADRGLTSQLRPATTRQPPHRARRRTRLLLRLLLLAFSPLRRVAVSPAP